MQQGKAVTGSELDAGKASGGQGVADHSIQVYYNQR